MSYLRFDGNIITGVMVRWDTKRSKSLAATITASDRQSGVGQMTHRGDCFWPNRQDNLPNYILVDGSMFWPNIETLAANNRVWLVTISGVCKGVGKGIWEEDFKNENR